MNEYEMSGLTMKAIINVHHSVMVNVMEQIPEIFVIIKQAACKIGYC